MYSLKLQIWEMPVLSKSTSLKGFKPENTDHRKYWWDKNMVQILTFGLWHAQFSSWWQTTSCLSRNGYKEFLRIRITSIKWFRFWVLLQSSLQPQALIVRRYSIRKGNYCMEILNSSFRLASYWHKTMIMTKNKLKKFKSSYCQCLNLNLQKDFLQENAYKANGFGNEIWLCCELLNKCKYI